MKKISLKYGQSTVDVSIPEKNIIDEVIPVLHEGTKDPYAMVKKALENPIKSNRLKDIARPGNSVSIVVDDVTRACPNHLILPPVLEELNEAGIKDDDITVILALGTHRLMTEEEINRRIGEDIVKRVRVINHSTQESDLVDIGKTSHGNEVKINRHFIAGDIRILLGDINYHYYAGYGGGRKSVLPGIASLDSVNFNHQMLFHPEARTGVLINNPIHEDMAEACCLAAPHFILNVVLNHQKEMIGAFSGDWEAAFSDGVQFLDRFFRVQCSQQADIVVTSAGGSPKDINLYQGYKAMDNASQLVKDGGVMVVFLECAQGIGQKVFDGWMRRFSDPRAAKQELEKKFIMGAHKAYYLLSMIQKVKVILFSSLDQSLVRNTLGLFPSSTPQEAVDEAFRIAGQDASVILLPYGYDTLPIIT